MSNTGQNTPPEKRRNRKAEQRNKKPEQQQNPKRQRGAKLERQQDTKLEQQQSPKLDQQPGPEPRLDVEEQISAAVALAEPVTVALTDTAMVVSTDTPIVASTEIVPVETVAPASSIPISFQSVANAHNEYTRKSFEETISFVEKLTRVRSLDKAIEVQTEFAKQAYVTFVAESQKICELYSELVRQILKPLAGYLAKASQTAR
jgi:phasin family protein